MITTGQIILNYLNNKNISQVILANMLDVTPQYINGIVSDRKSPSKNALKEIIRILKITSDDIDLINQYEVYRKSDIKKYVYDDSKNMSYIGIYTDGGYYVKNSNQSINLINFPSLENKKIKYIDIQTNLLKPYFNFGDILFLEKKDYLENEDIALIEYDNYKYLAEVEYTDDKMILRSLERRIKTYILTKTEQKKINVLGVFIGRYIKKGN